MPAAVTCGLHQRHPHGYRTRVNARNQPLPSALFDLGARKRTVSLTVNRDLYAKSKAAGINASRVAEAALSEALREAQRAVLRRKIQQDHDALARYVAEHGDPAAELREMFEPPDAA